MKTDKKAYISIFKEFKNRYMQY